MISVSLCMIVKNEEAVLARCLDSLAGLMDEIIIVDTGSEDSTKEIAANYTKKIYDFEWVDDFAAARNFSFSKATQEYIYIADADEVLEEVNRKRFLQLKAALLPEIDIVQMQYANQLEYGTTYNYDKEYRPKLFRRKRDFVWINRVHEMVRLEPVVYDSEIEILHKPHALHAKRDFQIFQKMLQKQEPLNKKLFQMYARELSVAGKEKDFMEAISFFSQATEDITRTEEEVMQAFCILARAYRNCSFIESEAELLFMKVAMKAVANHAPSEICYELGEFYFGKKDYKEAIIWYYNAIYETESILNIHCSGDDALQRLAECNRALGESKEEQRYLQRLEEWREEYANICRNCGSNSDH